ncbi:fungal hydrophobin [Penicillium cosmopolitanum]|uniref:Hydrophobin n=1 Tax=Penicillium cosmopolitanum TaxID=1131564 RepID=A0A9X0BC83_9EURO|nr:fungal hydrophobin [Penicillium cosmopolitanum]KAJ5404368.1 fungal hydrophobin [Penicillium cosmopolitanum]
MRFSMISVLSLVGAGVVAATPMEGSLSSNVMRRANTRTSLRLRSVLAHCFAVVPLTTPLDHIVDPILEDLGIDAANIVGSIGLLCDPYEASVCTTEPQCCTEANLLGGTVALGCAALKK